MGQITDQDGRHLEHAGHLLHAELTRCNPLGIFQRHGHVPEFRAGLQNRNTASIRCTGILRLPGCFQCFALLGLQDTGDIQRTGQAGTVVETGLTMRLFGQRQLEHATRCGNRGQAHQRVTASTMAQMEHLIRQ